MGKTLSKAGMRLNTRRQRSQLISNHQGRLNYSSLSAGSTNVVPRVLEVDRTLLNLRLQKDELSLYKTRLQEVTEKEMEILKQLLLNGRMDSAHLLLKKKRFQQYLVDNAMAELDSILSRHESSPTYHAYKTEAETCINRNSEALKRIQMILTLEDVERILDDGSDGKEKTQEVYKLMLLASVEERARFDEGLDLELSGIFASLGNGGQEVVEKTEVAAEDTSQVQDLIQLEEFMDAESRAKSFAAYMAGLDSKVAPITDEAAKTDSRPETPSVVPDVTDNSVMDSFGNEVIEETSKIPEGFSIDESITFSTMEVVEKEEAIRNFEVVSAPVEVEISPKQDTPKEEVLIQLNNTINVEGLKKEENLVAEPEIQVEPETGNKAGDKDILKEAKEDAPEAKTEIQTESVPTHAPANAVGNQEVTEEKRKFPRGLSIEQSITFVSIDVKRKDEGISKVEYVSDDTIIPTGEPPASLKENGVIQLKAKIKKESEKKVEEPITGLGSEVELESNSPVEEEGIDADDEKSEVATESEASALPETPANSVSDGVGNEVVEEKQTISAPEEVKTSPTAAADIPPPPKARLNPPRPATAPQDPDLIHFLDTNVNVESGKTAETPVAGPKVEQTRNAKEDTDADEETENLTESSSSNFPDAPANSVTDSIGTVDEVNSENLEVAKPEQVS